MSHHLFCRSSSVLLRRDAPTTAGSAPDAGIRVKTAEVTAIAADNALSGGRVIGETQTVTEFGICWATDDNPTIDDNRSTVAGDAASFACYATGLEANTTYCLRAYAMTSEGRCTARRAGLRHLSQRTMTHLRRRRRRTEPDGFDHLSVAGGQYGEGY